MGKIERIQLAPGGRERLEKLVREGRGGVPTPTPKIQKALGPNLPPLNPLIAPIFGPIRPGWQAIPEKCAAAGAE